MKFKIRGTIKINRKEQKFSKILEAENEKMVIHKLYSTLGNSHGLTRRNIKIDKIETMKK